MIKKILIFLGLSIFILNLSNNVEAGRRGGIIISSITSPPEGTWTYRKLVTISSSMISGTLTNFPVLISWGTDTAIALHAQANGNDIKFMSYDTTTQLFHEKEYYEGTSTGKGVFWVNIPELTSATYTMWMYYGNPSSNYQGTTATWNSNYVGVWHLNETTGLIINDSTVNANHGVVYGNMNLNIIGKINGADIFDGIDDRHNLGNSSTLNPGVITAEGWVRPASGALSNYRAFISRWGPGTTYCWELGICNGLFAFTISTDGVNYPRATAFAPTADTWYYVVGTYDGNNVRLYVNGVLQATTPQTGTIYSTSDNVYIGYFNHTNLYFPGVLDEIRVSNVTRSANWIITNYNNQNNPNAYITIGAEETL